MLEMQDLTLLLSFLCFTHHQPNPTRPSRGCQTLPSACGILEPAGKPLLPSLISPPRAPGQPRQGWAQHGALSCCHSLSGWKDISGF